MNEAMKQSLLAALRAVLQVAAGALVTHGLLNSNATQSFIAAGVFIATMAWSIWDKYGREIVLAHLEIWKATAQANAAKLKKNNITPVTSGEVVSRIDDNAGAINTNVTQGVVKQLVTDSVKTTTMMLLFLCLLAPQAFAQQRPRPALTGNIVEDIKAANQPSVPGLSGGIADLVAKIDGMALDDLKYAKALADADGGPTTKLASSCWQAWIDRIEKRQAANANPLPDPHLVTDVTKLLGLHDSLQASSPFMVACSPLANAMKQNVTQLIGAVAGGAAGIAKFLP